MLPIMVPRFSKSPLRAAGVLRSSMAVMLLLVPSSMVAQEVPRAARLSGRLGLTLSAPAGDFGKNTGNGVGVDVSGLLRIDKVALLNLRLDFAALSNGGTDRLLLPNSSGNAQLDLKTSNRMITTVTGLQLLGPRGVFTPYVAALGGFSYFFTTWYVESTNVQGSSYTSTMNTSDASLAYGGSAGAYVRVYSSGGRDVRFDLGARYLRHDRTEYLGDRGLEEGLHNNRRPVPLRGRADFATYYLGVNVRLF